MRARITAGSRVTGGRRVLAGLIRSCRRTGEPLRDKKAGGNLCRQQALHNTCHNTYIIYDPILFRQQLSR